MQNVYNLYQKLFKKIILENVKLQHENYSRNSRSSNLRTIFVMRDSQSNAIMKLKRSVSQRD